LAINFFISILKEVKFSVGFETSQQIVTLTSDSMYVHEVASIYEKHVKSEDHTCSVFIN
jgi:hypothetical protein